MAIYNASLCVYTVPCVLFSLPPCYHLPQYIRPLVLQLCSKYLTSHSLICLFSPAESFPLLVKVSWGHVRLLSDSLSWAAAQNEAVQCCLPTGRIAAEGAASVAGSWQRGFPQCYWKGQGLFCSQLLPGRD